MRFAINKGLHAQAHAVHARRNQRGKRVVGNCPGAHSTVISASASKSNSDRIAPKSRASKSGASRLGVPPPR